MLPPIFIVLILFLINAAGKNATQSTTTPTNASSHELYSITPIKASAPMPELIRALILSNIPFDAVSGSERYLVKIIPDELSS